MLRTRAFWLAGALMAAGAWGLSENGSQAGDGATESAHKSPASGPARLSGGAHVLQREIRKQLRARYLLHLPADYRAANSDRKWPLLVFLHGAGERGEDFGKIANLGPLGYARTQAEFPFVVAAPLCPLDHDWSPEVILALIEEVKAGCTIDPDRVYLTGYSMGGAGTWETAMDYPSVFAAIAPLCGRVIPLLSGHLWRTPIWVFHGEADSVVPLAQSQEMVEILRGMGNTQVKFTTYPGTDHGIWGEVYADPQLYAWLLMHKRSETPATP